jgi:hypothetical protein
VIDRVIYEDFPRSELLHGVRRNLNEKKSGGEIDEMQSVMQRL